MKEPQDSMPIRCHDDDGQFKQALYVELLSRSVSALQFTEMVNSQNNRIAAGVAIAALGAAVAVRANNDCGGLEAIAKLLLRG
ncbi:hypothetical protein ACHMW7_24065 [Aminobacter sp. UC22_36]|uniref:hypothetical protein n=1 Tax=Aminobacter sp. UC22_36 TaxID=3374549 RepID=UPI00375772AB